MVRIFGISRLSVASPFPSLGKDLLPAPKFVKKLTDTELYKEKYPGIPDSLIEKLKRASNPIQSIIDNDLNQRWKNDNYRS